MIEWYELGRSVLMPKCVNYLQLKYIVLKW